MDILNTTCTVLRTPSLESFMIVVGYYGHGLVGSIIALLLLGQGYIYKNERTKKAGVAVIVALIVAGLLAQILKEIVHLPRPMNRASQGFPSGHTSAAFSMATVLGITFPAFSPLFYFFAILTGISRLYLRAHFVRDVLGGIVLGLGVGIVVGRKIIPGYATARHGPMEVAAWFGAIGIGICALIFFHSVESDIQAHMSPMVSSTADSSATAILDFGTPGTRELLRYGWSGDESWFDGKQPVVWASGLASALTTTLPAVQDYRIRLNVFPYVPKGPPCQRLEVKVNNKEVTKFFLEEGWHWYEFILPKAAVKAGKNDIQFLYNYTESPKSLHRAADERPLSVAFNRLEFFSEPQLPRGLSLKN